MRTNRIASLRVLALIFAMHVFPRAVDAVPLLDDSFDEAVADGWNGLRGDWAVTGDGWYEGQGGWDSSSFAGDESWADYTFSFRGRGVGTPSDPTLSMFIVYFRASNITPVCVGCGRPDMDAYRLAVWHSGSRSSQNRVLLKRIARGNPVVTLFDESVTVPDREVQVEISVSGAHIDVSLDGEHIIDFIDDRPLPFGKIGVSAIWAGAARFDDVLVECSSPARLAWQIGVPTDSDEEYGTTPMQREPIHYTVPDDWATHINGFDEFWRGFPGQLNPPEDWPTMPQTVHVQFSLAAPAYRAVLHAWVSNRNVDQGERLRVDLNGAIADDVRVMNGWPAKNHAFSLGNLPKGEHVLSLSNTGGGGLTFDYLQLASDDESDGDGVPDACDNCVNVRNIDQRDADGDGLGNRCDQDLNNDCVIGMPDLAILMHRCFGLSTAGCDFDDDGIVGARDIAALIHAFGGPPDPSPASACAP